MLKILPKQHEAKEQIYQTTLDETHAKLPQTTMNNTVKYALHYATLHNDTKKAHTKFYYN